MSDSLMPFQPAIDEPSNILPSLKKPSSTSRVGTVTCCSLPMVSVKRKSANFASFSLINLITSAGVTVFLQSALCGCYGPGGAGCLLVNAESVPHFWALQIKHLCIRLGADAIIDVPINT